MKEKVSNLVNQNSIDIPKKEWYDKYIAEQEKRCNMCKLIELETNYGDRIQVADIKCTCIKNIIDTAPQCGQISEIILFGSSLEERCSEKSDIDLAIISKYGLSGLSSAKSFNEFMNKIYEFDMTQEYDRLYFKSIDEITKKKEKIPICRELIQKGKVIYRKA